MEESRNTQFAQRIRTRIWQELPEARQPVARHRCALPRLCAFGDGRAARLPADAVPAAARRTAGCATARTAAPLPGGLLQSRAAPRRHARRDERRRLGNPQPATWPRSASRLLGGEHLGSAEVEQAAAFLARHRGTDPATLAATLIAADAGAQHLADRRVAPGFGTLFGGIDPQAGALATLLRRGARSVAGADLGRALRSLPARERLRLARAGRRGRRLRRSRFRAARRRRAVPDRLPARPARARPRDGSAGAAGHALRAGR